MAEGVSPIASTDDRRLIEDYLPIQAARLRLTRRRVRADLHAVPSGRAAQAGVSREKSVHTGHIPTPNWRWTARYHPADANKRFKHYWLCFVWDPLGQSPDLVAIQNPAKKLDYAKREIMASR